ncbi:MAG: alpha/beta hydrolase [Christensenellales bacterium]|jgi:putative tributyrin esterase
MALLKLNFKSQYLGNSHEVSIILPDKPRDTQPADFYLSGRRYKVLWLLHGTYGDHSDWVRKSMIELYACERDLIVVMPSALNSEYANWPDFSIGFNMYDYLTQELMPLVYNWLPASRRREDNFIAGLSMGGYGALVYALNHPEKFAAAAVLSYPPMNRENARWEDLDRRTQNDINKSGGMDAWLDSYENLWRLIDEKAHTGQLPRLYFAIGTEDFFWEKYREFKAHAQQIALEATFEEEPGFGHEWRFWDMYIQKALTFFSLDEKDDQGNPY